MPSDSGTTPTAPWPLLDRMAAWVGIWALRRLYGTCDTDVRDEYPDDRDIQCMSCDAARLIRGMEEIAHGR